MSYFDPTPSEMLFRLFVSLAGLVMVGLALWMRGMPAGGLEATLGLGALCFLAMSAGVSGQKFRDLRGG